MMATAASEVTPAASKNHHWLVVDFDGTCTEQETTSLLPKIAAKLSGDGTLEERIALFKTFEDEYYQLYNVAKEKMCSETMSLEEALDSLDEVSNLVTEHVSASGVLKGLNASSNTIANLIESDEKVRDNVALRSGCLDVLTRKAANGWLLGILSINWSPSLIHAAIVRPLSQRVLDTVDVPIWSNLVNSNGVLSLKIPGALAKRACIQKLKPNFVVYVGDSSTDLLALIEADIGILIGSSNSAIDVANRWRIQVFPLSKRPETTTRQDDDTANVIWRAKNWLEIDQLLKDL